MRAPPAAARVDDAVQRVRRSRLLRGSARGGLIARGTLYLLLAYLAAAVAGGWTTQGKQANANGALLEVAATPLGFVALAGAALGFLAFATTRFAGALGDHRESRARRVTTAGQAMFYLALACTTAMFVFGRRSTGSEQQQESTVAQLADSSLGRLALGGCGIAMVAVCAWQVWLGVRGGFEDSLRTENMPPRVRRLAKLVGTIGICARAVAVAPIGVLLLVAAYRGEPGRAEGLDRLLRQLNDSAPGSFLVWLIAVGFLIFAGYSFLEAGYRRVHAGT